MPLRPSKPSALSAWARKCTLARPFSSSTPVAAFRDAEQPARHSPSAPRQAPSSSSNLLNMGTGANRPTQRAVAGSTAERLSSRFQERFQEMAKTKQRQVDQLREQKTASDFLKQLPRQFQQGDLYSPHDLSGVEMMKWRRKTPRTVDVVDTLGISPLDLYKNFTLIQEFTSSASQIHSSKITKLRPVNQRKIAKMIRRAQGMGLYPTIHAHPELIRSQFYPTAFSR